MTDPFADDPILVEVVRNGLVESVHRARVAITGPDGALLGAASEPSTRRSIRGAR